MDKNKFNKKRAPIITVAGHIDHGKTTFLNFVSKKLDPQKEYGDITQHIKAYYVNTVFGPITFLDTPGHFAFNSNRENSIKISDIVLLIISIDDGIKPQTVESINIAKKFNIPIVVAINKIDKVSNLVEREDQILQELLAYNLTAEKWGGDVIISLISAKTGKGINELLELLKFQSDLLDLNINDNDEHYGIILENKIDVCRGNLTTLILKNGELKKGSFIKIANNYAKIKNIYDLDNNIINEVHSSFPINVTGLNMHFDIGEKFEVILKNVKKIKNNFYDVNTISNLKSIYNVDDLLNDMKKKNSDKINVIFKVDVQGSVNVVKLLADELSKNDIKINIVKIEIGNFNESDLDLAKITLSLLLGFNVKIDNKIKKIAANMSLNLYNFHVIYSLIDFLKEKIDEKFLNNSKSNMLGSADIKKIFKNKDIVIAGCLVTYGKIKQNSNIVLKRQNVIIHQGSIDSIKVLKLNVKEVKIGMECGIIIKKYNKFQINDIIEVC